MNVMQLQAKLDAEGVNPRAYSLTGGDYDERYVLSLEASGRWIIYFSERGERTGERVFSSEAEACEEFLKTVLRDPLARTR